MRFFWLALLFGLALPAAAWDLGGAKLLYSSLEAEAAGEYQTGDGQFGPGYLRLISRTEVALNDQLTGKAVLSPCGGPYNTQPRGITECSVKRLVEEFTLNGVYNGFDFSLGRQIITQGNTEGFVLLDRFNGRDFCRFARLDWQNKLPNWLARGRAIAGNNTFTMTFAPFSGTSELPFPGSYCDDRYHNAGRFAGVHDPNNDSIADWAGGLEFATSHQWWSAALNVMSTKEDLFVLETVPTLQKTHPRTMWLGGTAAATLGGYVLRTEIAYAPWRDFTLDPALLGGMLVRGIPTNGIDQRWNLLTSVGVEGKNFDWYWALQYFDDRIESGPGLLRQEVWRMASLRLRKTFFNDRLALESFAVLDMDYSDFALRAAISYDIDGDTTITVGGTTYSDIDKNTGLFGSYVGRDNVFLKLRRTLF